MLWKSWQIWVKTLKEIPGHANVGIPMHLYVDVTEEKKFKEVEKIESALKSVWQIV